jgi:hypothetical protein
VIIDQLEQLWNSILEFTTQFVVPDWGSLVDLLPELLFVFVIGPIFTLLALAWVVYFVRRPRVRAAARDLRRPAPLDAEGNPVFPTGEPYSAREAMIYEPGTTRSPSGEDLVLACPRCGLVRPAATEACGNCGLAFTLRPATITLRPAGPPPGGATAA